MGGVQTIFPEEITVYCKTTTAADSNLNEHCMSLDHIIPSAVLNKCKHYQIS